MSGVQWAEGGEEGRVRRAESWEKGGSTGFLRHCDL